jgi:acyl-CoA synthetase (AMP-forming)/AMP-acid ligase II
VRVLIIGGEAVEREPVATWFQREGHRPALFNAYGPTETTVNATIGELTEEGQWLSIGRPIPNTRIYILDARRQPVPLGVIGELYIAGAGVARGYLNRPEITSEKFTTGLFADRPDERVYRTGDLGRYRADGRIEFFGRNDQQVKIRGFRIELGEVEARLHEHPSVREAAVIAREDIAGDKRLVAYVVPQAEATSDLSADLRAHLTDRLPDFMIPAAYVRLAQLPLTSGGKLDRKALPAPQDDAYVSRSYEAPYGATENAIANIWTDLLHVARIGRHDSFFELGGHSLLATKLILRIGRDLGVDLAVRDVFLTPTVASLAARAIDVQLAQFNPLDLQQLLSQSAGAAPSEA